MVKELPIIEAIHERDRADDERRREIQARCVTIERACRAIGFGAGEGYERVATLVARVAGHGVLVRTAAEISEDKDVNLSISQVRRAIDELEKFEVLIVDKQKARTEGSVAKRGRKVIIYRLQVNSEGLANVLAEVRKSHEIPPAELTASSPHDPRTIAAQSPQDPRTIAPQSPHLQNHSYSNPYTQIPDPIPNGMADGSDQKDGVVLTKDQVAATAARLFRGLQYTGSDGQTLWQVAAAFDAGLLSEFVIADAVRASHLMAKTSKIGYFRRVLAQRCQTDAAGLVRLLSKVAIKGGFPSQAPPANPPTSTHPFRSVPARERTAANSDAVANERRNTIAVQLRELEGAK